MCWFDPVRLVRARRARGLSHEQLAARINHPRTRRFHPWVTVRDLVELEVQGCEAIEVATLQVLARCLDVRPSEFLDVPPDGPTLYELIAAAGMSIDEFAARTGRAQRTWRQVMDGRQRTHHEVLSRAATILEVTPLEVVAALDRGIRQRVSHATAAQIEEGKKLIGQAARIRQAQMAPKKGRPQPWEQAPEVTLAELRADAGLSRASCARTLGVEPEFWKRIEDGVAPMVGDLVQRVARVLDVPAHHVYLAHERSQQQNDRLDV